MAKKGIESIVLLLAVRVVVVLVVLLWGQLLVVQKWRGQGLCHG